MQMNLDWKKCSLHDSVYLKNYLATLQFKLSAKVKKAAKPKSPKKTTKKAGAKKGKFVEQQYRNPVQAKDLI